MKQLSIWIIAFWMAMTAGAATVQAQSVNMSRYITLTVKSGQPIELNFQAAAAGTPVRVVSGSNTTDVTVNATGDYWSPDQNFTSDGTTMTVYGDITGFNCSINYSNLTGLDLSRNRELGYLNCSGNRLTALDLSGCARLETLACFSNGNTFSSLNLSGCNGLKTLKCQENGLTALDVSGCPGLEDLACFGNRLTALDVSACTQLKRLYCFKNEFSTAALNRLYCSLPDRTGLTPEGKIVPAYNATDAGHADVLASSGRIATGKNWKVIYESDGSDIPTTGTETCGSSALAVSPATLSFVAAGEMKPITVTASGAWTAASSETWLTLSAGSGTGNGSVDATAAANPGTTPRTAKVTFTAGSITREVNVTQQAASAPPTLTVSPATLSFVAAGEMKPITVTANGAWTAVSSETWLTLSAGSGTGNGSVDATAAANPGTTPRTATLTFTAGALTQTVNVTQAGAAPVLSVTPATLSFVAAGEMKPITVTANGAWTAVSSESWLTLSAGSGTGNGSVDATAAANPGTTPRTATVTFTMGSLTRTVNVTQAGAAPVLSATPAALSFAITGGNLSLAVTANMAWTVTSSEAWLTLAPATGTGDATVSATAAANPGIPRTATLTLSGGGLTKTIAVTQAGTTLSVAPAALTFTYAGEDKALTVTATRPWTARCDAPWLTLSAASGTGNGTITVTAPAYADEWPRTAKIFFVSGALKDTVTVTQHPKPGPKFVALDYTELTLPVGASQRLVVTAYPKDADINRGVTWYSLNDDIARVSANGTVTALAPGRTDITVVANVGGQQTACRVRVVPAEQMVTVVPGSDNTLRLSLMARSDADFTLSFDVDLPEGFALDTKKTAPDASLAARYAVTVTGNRVEMKPNGLRAGGTIEKRDLLTLACTAVPGTSNGSYNGALRNLAFTPTTGYALQNVTVPFTFTYTVGNETIDGLRVYAAGSALHLTLPQAETVHIYNVEGAMVKTLALPAGDHVQPLPSGVYLVRVGERVMKIVVK